MKLKARSEASRQIVQNYIFENFEIKEENRKFFTFSLIIFLKYSLIFWIARIPGFGLSSNPSGRKSSPPAFIVKTLKRPKPIMPKMTTKYQSIAANLLRLRQVWKEISRIRKTKTGYLKERFSYAQDSWHCLWKVHTIIS